MAEQENHFYMLAGVAAVAAIGCVLITHARKGAAVPATAAVSPAPVSSSPSVRVPGVAALAPNVGPMNSGPDYLTRSMGPPAPLNSFIPNAGYSDMSAPTTGGMG